MAGEGGRAPLSKAMMESDLEALSLMLMEDQDQAPWLDGSFPGITASLPLSLLKRCHPAREAADALAKLGGSAAPS